MCRFEIKYIWTLVEVQNNWKHVLNDIKFRLIK